MKTTMNLPDALMEAVKQRAREEGRTHTSVVEDALRRFLGERPSAQHRRPMPRFGTRGANAFLIDIEDKDALYAALDGDRTA